MPIIPTIAEEHSKLIQAATVGAKARACSWDAVKDDMLACCGRKEGRMDKIWAGNGSVEYAEIAAKWLLGGITVKLR